MKKYFNNQGFVFIDLLTATVILSLALTSLLGVVVYTSKVRSAADHRTIATRIIQAQFNDLQKSNFAMGSPSWTTINSTEVQKIIDTANSSSNGPGNVNMNFTISSSLVTSPSQIPTTGLQGVAMTVSWINSNKAQESITAIDYFFTSDASFTGGLTYVSLSSQ